MNQAKSVLKNDNNKDVSADDRDLIFKRLDQHNIHLNYYYREEPIPESFMKQFTYMRSK